MTLDEGGWRRAAVRAIRPPAALSGIVELFWIDEWDAAQTAGRRFRIVADDAPHILLHVSRNGGRAAHRLTLVGARAWHHDADLSGRKSLIGARLRPGALPLVTHLPASRFTNRSVALTEIVDSSLARAIRQMRATCPDAALDQLAALIALLPRRPDSAAPRGARDVAVGCAGQLDPSRRGRGIRRPAAPHSRLSRAAWRRACRICCARGLKAGPPAAARPSG